MNNKEELKNEMLAVVDRFYKQYKLPSENIVTEIEWDAFLNVIEAHFLANNKADEYVHAVNIIVRRALSLVEINNDDFKYEFLKSALCDLSAYHISHDEIEVMREEMDEKVIQLNSAKLLKKLKTTL